MRLHCNILSYSGMIPPALPLMDSWTKGLLTISLISPRSGPDAILGLVMYVHHRPGKSTRDLVHSQINTLDWKKPRGPITRSKLAFKIAKAINSFIEVCQCDYS